MGGIPPAEAPVAHLFSPSLANLQPPYSEHEQKRAHLYVGNLSPRVTEYMLTEIFAVAGPVQHVKIIPDRNYQHGGLNYGFVEYIDMRAAETALQTLNGRKVFDTEIRVNWAYQGQQNKEDTSNHYHVFVGDLSPEVNDDVLAKAFAAFGTLSDARVMWDMNSGKSRGYGFLAFRDKTDAEQAIATMNGEWLGSRAIRVNWANQKTQGGPATTSTGSPMSSSGTAPAPMNFMGGPLSYETVVTQTPAFNTTVYVGNLVPYCTQADLIPLFQSIGYLSEIRMQADRGFAFVKLDTHEHAAMAIVQLQGQMVHGRPIKCSWGKDRADGGTLQTGALSPAPSATPYGNMVRWSNRSPSDFSLISSRSAHVRHAAAQQLWTVRFWFLPGKPRRRCPRDAATRCWSCCWPDCARCGWQCRWTSSSAGTVGERSELLLKLLGWYVLGRHLFQ
jgi:nucleolysin TIA-1/TIAR